MNFLMLLNVINREQMKGKILTTQIDIEKMSISEKLRIMELLWDDLCHAESDIPSPQWHENVLMERENLIRDGKDEFVDWDQAKKEMRQQIS